MKTLSIKKFIVLLSVVILAASCGKEDDNGVSNDNGDEPSVFDKNVVAYSISVTKKTQLLSKSTGDDDTSLPEYFVSGDYLEVSGDGVSGILTLKKGCENQSSVIFEGTLTLADGTTLTDNTPLSVTLKNTSNGNDGKILSVGEIMKAATLEEAYQKYSSLTASFNYGDSDPVSLTENNAFVEVRGRVGETSVTINSQNYTLTDGSVCLVVADNTELECDLIPGGSTTVRSLSKSTPVDGSNELVGFFSVSADKKVRFGKGNLQYNTTTRRYEFANNQYDYNGSSNSRVIDLFGWGTGDNPAETSTSNATYANFVDWGNKFGTGWRTLSQIEWNYLLNVRPDADAKNFFGFIATVTTNEDKDTLSYNFGLIILPDNWIEPETKDSVADNIYTIDEWKLMGNAGAVFLPATNKTSFADREQKMTGSYWTSTSFSATGYASRISFYHNWDFIEKSNTVPMWYDPQTHELYFSPWYDKVDREYRQVPSELMSYDVLWYSKYTDEVLYVPSLSGNRNDRVWIDPNDGTVINNIGNNNNNNNKLWYNKNRRQALDNSENYCLVYRTPYKDENGEEQYKWYDPNEKTFYYDAPNNLLTNDKLWYDTNSKSFRQYSDSYTLILRCNRLERKNFERVDIGVKGHSYGLDFGEYSRSNHFSVRLVRNAETL